MNAADALRDALATLRSAAGTARAWGSAVPALPPGAAVPAHAPAPPAEIVTALRRATAAFVAAELTSTATVCEAAATAVQRMADMPALVTAEAASAVQRALSILLACAAEPQRPQSELFPVYRAMQHLAGADRIHPADLWSIRPAWRDLAAEPWVSARQPDAQTRVDIEAALLALMRQPGPEACAQMSDLCAALGAGQQGRLATLWRVAAAVYDAQRAQLLRPDVYLKRIGPRLLAMARGTGVTSESLDLLLRDLLYHCSQAADHDSAHSDASTRLRQVIETFGLPWQPAHAATAASPPGLAALWAGTPLAQAVPGLPSAADLDLSDLTDWTEARAGDTPEAATSRPRPLAPQAGAAPRRSPPAVPPQSQPPRARTSVAGIDGESDPSRGTVRPPDPIETQFSALERACAAIEDALASLRRHLGATDDTYEPGSDPMISDGARLALDAAAAGVATVARTAHALRLATDTLRKVRFDAITGRLHEYVSRVARDQARPVRWALYGGSEHLDRTLLDKLAEPVEQLLRLSIEHGIEPALERQQAAKPAAGYVELRVSRQVDGLAIDVSDDGAPLDFASLRAQAGRLGLPALGAPPTAEQLEALLTAPGLIAAQTAQAGNPTLRRAATWAQLLAALHALGGSLELPLEAPGRNTVRVVLRD